MPEFNGKVALVTGGSSGIGRATALAFAREGAAVVIGARREHAGEGVVAEIAAAGGRATFVQTDVGRIDEVERLILKTVEEHGRIDCAFNNAASDEGAFKPAADFDIEEFDRVMAVNLRGVWLCMKHEIKQMLRQEPEGGAIVNMSSVNGLGGAPQGALYSATKAGVLALTKSAAQDYATSGIRINAIAAGFFQTPMLERVLDRASGGDPEAAKAVWSQVEQMVPQKRVGRPEEVAEAVLWLCSERASYVTGHSMIVDGGLTSLAR